MSYLISARVPETTGERIRQYARRKQRSVNEVVTVAVEEWLRQNEFAHIEFRDTPDGRIPFMKGSRLPVYWVVKIAKGYDLDVDQTVAYWSGEHSREWVQAAFNYYEAFAEEIDAQIADAATQTFEDAQAQAPPIAPVGSDFVRNNFVARNVRGECVMLTLLLDEHISPVVAEQLRTKRAEIDIQSIFHWRNGAFVGVPDPAILAALQTEVRVLVTYDTQMLSEWSFVFSGEAPFAGVIFVDERTIAPNNLGGLVLALLAL